MLQRGGPAAAPGGRRRGVRLARRLLDPRPARLQAGARPPVRVVLQVVDALARPERAGSVDHEALHRAERC